MRRIALAIVATVLLAPNAFALSDAQRQTSAALRTSCSEDVQRLCPDVSPGGRRVLQCLKEHKSEVSPTCKASFEAIKQQREAAQQSAR